MPKLSLQNSIFENTNGMTVFLVFGFPEEHSNSEQVLGVYASEEEAYEVSLGITGGYVVPAVVGQRLEM
jgi:hypothetical protein